MDITPPPYCRWALLIFLGFVTLSTTVLGIWQIQRLSWKTALIARVDARVHAEPMSPPESTWTSLNREQHEYLRVQLFGTFRHDLEIPVYASTARGPGFWVMTPLTTARGIVWVNRGFVDAAHKDPATRVHEHGEEEVEITGLVRMPEQSGVFLRANVPAEQRWYTRAPEEFSVARGLSAPTAPWFLDQDSDISGADWPVPGLTVIQFRNQHLSYALTWFALAGLSVFALWLAWRQRAEASSGERR